MDALTDMPEEVKAKTLSDTLAVVKAEAVVDALVKTLAEVEEGTLSNTMVEVKAGALLDALADWPTKVECEMPM